MDSFCLILKSFEDIFDRNDDVKKKIDIGIKNFHLPMENKIIPIIQFWAVPVFVDII